MKRMISQWDILHVEEKKYAPFPRIFARESGKKGELLPQNLLPCSWHSIIIPKRWLTPFTVHVRILFIVNFWWLKEWKSEKGREKGKEKRRGGGGREREQEAKNPSYFATTLSFQCDFLCPFMVLGSSTLPQRWRDPLSTSLHFKFKIIEMIQMWKLLHLELPKITHCLSAWNTLLTQRPKVNTLCQVCCTCRAERRLGVPASVLGKAHVRLRGQNCSIQCLSLSPTPFTYYNFLFFGVRNHYVAQAGLELPLPLPSGITSLGHHAHPYVCTWNSTRCCKLIFMGFNWLISSPIFCVHISLSVCFIIKKSVFFNFFLRESEHIFACLKVI